MPAIVDSDRYARCINASKRVRWDIDEDVIRGRGFDRSQKYLPDGLSLVSEFTTLASDEKRFVSQIQGWTYTNIFGLVERFIGAKILEVSRDHWLGDQTALEALVRFTDEELKHQEMFRRIERMVGEGMPAGYRLMLDPNEVARAVLSKSTWAVLALTCHIELFTQQHYKQSIAPQSELSDLYKDSTDAPGFSRASAFRKCSERPSRFAGSIPRGIQTSVSSGSMASKPLSLHQCCIRSVIIGRRISVRRISSQYASFQPVSGLPITAAGNRPASDR